MKTLLTLTNFYNEIKGKYSIERIKANLDLDNFLLNYYFENTIEYFFVVENIENENFVLSKKSELSDNNAIYTREWTDGELEESPKYEKVINFIKENYLENIDKAYDIWVKESRGYDSWHFRVRQCKKNPKYFSITEKTIAVYKILSKMFQHDVKRDLAEENKDKETIINFSDKLRFFSNKLKTEADKCAGDSLSSICFSIAKNAYEEIQNYIELKYPFYFEEHEILKKEKLVWNKNPDMFFIIFSALIEEGFLRTENNKAKLSEISDILRNFIEVSPKQESKNEYSKQSFLQQLKQTNVKHDKDGIYYEDRCRVINLLKEISNKM